MNDEVQEHRQRFDAALKLIQADLIRVKEAARQELDQMRQLRPRAVFASYPLVFVGAAAGVGFLLGVRGGRTRSAFRALKQGAGEEVVKALGHKTLGRRIGETLLLALAQRGASYFADQAMHRFEEQRERPREPEMSGASERGGAGL